MEKPLFYTDAKLYLIDIQIGDAFSKIRELQDYITYLEKSKPKPKRYRTRDGQDVEMITEEGRGEYPKIGYIGNNEIVTLWSENNEYNLLKQSRVVDSDKDLIEIPEPSTSLSIAIEQVKEQARIEGLKVTVIVE